jgi:hypothetical protein
MTPSSPEFKDHFSAVAASYARYRPGYPAVLFETLAGLAPARDLAWDCATGNGQAALHLAEHFARVVATDLSQEQLGRAIAAAPHCRSWKSPASPPSKPRSRKVRTPANSGGRFRLRADHSRSTPTVSPQKAATARWMAESGTGSCTVSVEARRDHWARSMRTSASPHSSRRMRTSHGLQQTPQSCTSTPSSSGDSSSSSGSPHQGQRISN